MDPTTIPALEGDPRFPSGPWTGFYLQWWMPGRHTMTIDLTFQGGRLQALGSDRVGSFDFQGEYDPSGGQCRWVKHYFGQHQVTYKGVNEGEGIWGVWEIRVLAGLYRDSGVFHIWPVGTRPTEASQAAVQAYLSQVRRYGLTRLAVHALVWGLGAGAFYLVHHFAHLWCGVSVP
jgi:hypothetical protein